MRLLVANFRRGFACLFWLRLRLGFFEVRHDFCPTLYGQSAYKTEKFSCLYFGSVGFSFFKLFVCFVIFHVGLVQLVVCVIHVFP